VRIDISEAWRTTYPDATVGVLEMSGVANPKRHTQLDEKKAELEQQLRNRYSGADRATLKALPTITAYTNYYKRFKKSYHVLFQLESVLLTGRPIPKVAALVEAMFMAEINNQLLTAGHDWEKLEQPVTLDVAGGDETYVRINGQEQQLKKNDMFIADAQGVISSVIYGPDQRTRINFDTRHVLFTVYAPAGIGKQLVEQHLQQIQSNALLVAPEAQTLSLMVYGKA
jgi:DNA/RNA-binding domain of Phe-tRNA-synthetase-like protein